MFDCDELFESYEPKFYMGEGVNCVYIGETKDDGRHGFGIELSQCTGDDGKEVIIYKRGIFRTDELFAGQRLTRCGRKFDLSEGFFKKGIVLN